MNKVSNAERLGVVARVAKRQAQKSRTLRAISGAMFTTARALGSVVHQLWLEVIGLVFLVMAVSGAAALAHEYEKYHAGKVGFGRVVLATCFTLTFAWFGVSSFWRGKRKEKKRTTR